MEEVKHSSEISFEGQNVIEIDVEKEVRTAFLDYAMSVIVSRALPDVRDGLKPVHRRILYTMYEANLTPDRPYRKSVTTVGDVLGHYHPHGDSSVYDAMVRLAQTFSLRYPLIDGQGNFGSIDGDPPAAYRYTEARMKKIALEMLTDIRKNTVDFMPNFDDKSQEPTVLPSRFPNLLVNGSSGIAVGMATEIPPHNLGEVIDGTIALMENPELDVDGLMEYIKGPDFPTGGIIMGRTGIRNAYRTGRGKIYVRAKADIEEYKDGKFHIVVTEIPYGVRKAALIEKIADEVKGERITGISNIRDESDKDGLRFVVEIKREANPQVVLNQLYKYTDMQATCSAIMIALVNNVPRVLNLKQMLEEYIKHQKNVITRRTQFDIDKAKARAHILEGLIKAIDYIDEVIEIIKKSKSISDAKQALCDRFELDDIQAQAIVDMRLGQLSGLERDKIETEYQEIEQKIAELEAILADENKVIAIIKTDLLEIKRKYADARRTEIGVGEIGLEDEDLIPVEDCVFTLTNQGYVKRIAVSEYRSQHRGGQGVRGMTTKQEDVVREMFVGSTHDTIIFFTNLGRAYKSRGYEIASGTRTSKGTNVINLLPLMSGEKVTSMIRVPQFNDGEYMLMATKYGTVKKTPITDYANIRKSGVIAIIIDENDQLESVVRTTGDDNIILASNCGKAIKFNENDVRSMGRVTRGVRGMRLEDDDFIVGMAVERPNATLLSVTEKGYGKRTALSEYRLQTRGGKGIGNYNITDKTGKVAAISVVDDNNDLLLLTSGAAVMRTSVSEIPVIARTTQGVRIVRLDDGVSIVDISRTDKQEQQDTNVEAVLDRQDSEAENLRQKEESDTSSQQ